MKTDIEKLLEIKAKHKSKKPRFLVQDTHKRKELSAKWRKPRGVQSKLRLGKKGRRKKPSQGFRSPKLVRGLHKTGLSLVRVCSLKELENLPRDVGVVLSSRLGQKNKFKIVKKAQQLKIKIVNIKPEEFLKRLEEKKEEKIKEKEEKKKEIKKKEKKKVKEKKKEEEKEEKEGKVVKKEEEVKEKEGEKKEEKKEEVKKEKKIEKKEEREEKEFTEKERKEAEKKEKDKLLTKRVR